MKRPRRSARRNCNLVHHRYGSCRAKLRFRYDSSCRRRMPAAKSLEPVDDKSTKPPMEHITAACSANDHPGRASDQRAIRRGRAGNRGFLIGMDRSHRHNFQYNGLSRPYCADCGRLDRRRAQRHLLQPIERRIHYWRSRGRSSVHRESHRSVRCFKSGIDIRRFDSDILFHNDGEALLATPAGLATTQGQGAYDLESILAHQLGH
jgi:hypothetical protein